MVDSTLWTEEEKARAGHRFAQRMKTLVKSRSFQEEAKRNKIEVIRAVKAARLFKSKKLEKGAVVGYDGEGSRALKSLLVWP